MTDAAGAVNATPGAESVPAASLLPTEPTPVPSAEPAAAGGVNATLGQHLADAPSAPLPAPVELAAPTSTETTTPRHRRTGPQVVLRRCVAWRQLERG